MQFTLTLDTTDLTMRKILNLCADLEDKGLIESYTPSPEPRDRSDLMDAYELLFILPPSTISAAKDIRSHPTIIRMRNIVEKGGGIVEKVESWGKKHLAFNIGELEEGDYVMFSFMCDRKIMKKVDKYCRDTESSQIIRHMVVRKNTYAA